MNKKLGKLCFAKKHTFNNHIIYINILILKKNHVKLHTSAHPKLPVMKYLEIERSDVRER